MFCKDEDFTFSSRVGDCSTRLEPLRKSGGSTAFVKGLESVSGFTMSGRFVSFRS